MATRKVILYIACSLDGYIAQPGDDLSFLDSMQKEGEDYGYHTFIAEVDTILMGRKTYDWVVNAVGKFPHEDTETYIINRTPRPAEGKVQFYTGNLITLVQELKVKPGGTIFCDGGAQLVNALLQEKLLDELIISVVPVLLGDGIRLFQDGRPELGAQLLEVKHFDTGLVQLHYQLKQS